MPGKKARGGSFMEAASVYRKLTNADNNSPANIQLIPEVIDFTDRMFTVGNMLHAQIIVPTTITDFDVEVYGTIDEQLNPRLTFGATRWSLIDGLSNRKRSTFITVADIPPGLIKILVTNVTGTGSIIILQSRSA